MDGRREASLSEEKGSRGPSGVRRAAREIDPTPSSSSRRRLSEVARRLAGGRAAGVVAAVLLLSAVLSVTTGTFFRAGNLLDVARQMSLLGLMTIGLTFVLVSGQIDLSVGSTYGLSGVVCGWVLLHDGPLPAAILAGILVGVLAGLANGILSSHLGLPSFIVTLGTLQVLRGIALLITDGAPVGLFGLEIPGIDAFFFAGQGRVLGAPMQFIILILVAIVASVVLHRTWFGLQAYASGGSPRAAELAGVPVRRVQTIAFVISGTLAAVSGLLGFAFIGSVTPTGGQGVEFDVFAAAVLGGASLFGGEGTIWGAVLGAALLGILRNGMILLDISAFWQIVVTGLVAIVAIGVNKAVAVRRQKALAS